MILEFRGDFSGKRLKAGGTLAKSISCTILNENWIEEEVRNERRESLRLKDHVYVARTFIMRGSSLLKDNMPKVWHKVQT